MDIRFRIGLKLYSTDSRLSDEARVLAGDMFDYVELYAVPGSHGLVAGIWRGLDVPYVVHAPHSAHGVNLASAGRSGENRRILAETQAFATDLGAAWILVHPGNNGTLEEAIRQMRLLDDSRLIVENKPKVGLEGAACVGWSPNELRCVLESGAVSGTALDFVHAACAARSSGSSEGAMLAEFLDFGPKVFHLADGDSSTEKDRHLGLGRGDLDIAAFAGLIPDGALVTLETPRDPARGLDDFCADVEFLRNMPSVSSEQVRAAVAGEHRYDV